MDKQTKQLIKGIQDVADLEFVKYKALIKSGFTEKQALEIVKVRGAMICSCNNNHCKEF